MNNLPYFSSPPLAPTGMREDRFLSHDGPIWPRPRPHMSDVNAIRRRMAEDVADLVGHQNGEPCVTRDDLQTYGWTRGQVLAHGDHAIRRALKVD